MGGSMGGSGQSEGFVFAPSTPDRATVRAMRRFTSYGPADPEEHFCVERRELLAQCVEQLVGTNPAKGGRYFTIWGPRQTGKTWIMRRAIEEIRERFGDRFLVGKMSMQGAIIDDHEPPEALFKYLPDMFRDAFHLRIAKPVDWSDVRRLFSSTDGIFEGKPIILLIDEFDSLRPATIDRLVTMFRDIYLARENHVLHGLALIGVRAVLGVDSPRGSPFNVQRSLQIPNLTQDEVVEMFQQYQSESGQVVDPAVVQALFDSTRGQPGLIGWFGELLTEKYNPGKDKPITMSEWHRVYYRAMQVEWNNTLLNLGKKARGPYRADVMRLFTDPNVEFALEEEWCSFLYMNGIIDEVIIPDVESTPGEKAVCRFSCPFVQDRLYRRFSRDMFGDKGPILAIEMGDTLEDVFTAEGIDAPKLLERYRGYLKRLKAKGIDPWVGQPRRADLHFTEAVGHFHLYAWLQNSVGRRCTVSPEFPTGNGKVDLVLQTKDHTAVIEVKSLREVWELQDYRKQAARYATKLGLTQSTLVVFAPVDDESVLLPYAGEALQDGVRVTTVPFGWV